MTRARISRETRELYTGMCAKDLAAMKVAFEADRKNAETALQFEFIDGRLELIAAEIEKRKVEAAK